MNRTIAASQLCFDEITPLAPRALGGLVRDHFCHGRLFATVGAHGGLLGVSYWGNQHLGAPNFFKGDAESAWVKLFRVCVRVGAQRYYPVLNDTRLYPFDHEGLTLTPWGDRPVDIRGLNLHGISVDLKIRGRGNQVGSLKLNGKPLPAGSRKIAWTALKGKRAQLELVRSSEAPKHPVIVRADGLRMTSVTTAPGCLLARVAAGMSGELVVQAAAGAQVRVNGKAAKCGREKGTGTFAIAISGRDDVEVVVRQRISS